eukprot:SAG22_NODE_318_length_12494_cov_18.507705_4_plen_94_part_00
MSRVGVLGNAGTVKTAGCNYTATWDGLKGGGAKPAEKPAGKKGHAGKVLEYFVVACLCLAVCGGGVVWFKKRRQARLKEIDENRLLDPHGRFG